MFDSIGAIVIGLMAVAGIVALVFRPYYDWLHDRMRLPPAAALAAQDVGRPVSPCRSSRVDEQIQRTASHKRRNPAPHATA